MRPLPARFGWRPLHLVSPGALKVSRPPNRLSGRGRGGSHRLDIPLRTTVSSAVRLAVHEGRNHESGGLAYLALFLRRTLNAQGCIGNGFKAELGDLLAALFAQTVAAVLDPLESPIDLVESILLAAQQTQGELLIEVIAAKLCHIAGHARRSAVVLVQGAIFHLRHIALKSCTQSQESFSMTRVVRFCHSVKPLGWIVQQASLASDRIDGHAKFGEKWQVQADEPSLVSGGLL